MGCSRFGSVLSGCSWFMILGLCWCVIKCYTIILYLILYYTLLFLFPIIHLFFLLHSSFSHPYSLTIIFWSISHSSSVLLFPSQSIILPMLFLPFPIFILYVSAFGYPYLYYQPNNSHPACFIGVDGWGVMCLSVSVLFWCFDDIPVYSLFWRYLKVILSSV